MIDCREDMVTGKCPNPSSEFLYAKTFSIFPESKSVTYLFGDFGTPFGLTDCTIFDSQSWVCPFPDHSGGRFIMDKGKYFETSVTGVKGARQISQFEYYFELLKSYMSGKAKA